jgi:hypothetical protein
MAVITLEDKIKITTFHPPSGFDPLIASDAELEWYGFPARPSDPDLLARYKRVFLRLKGRFDFGGRRKPVTVGVTGFSVEIPVASAGLS